MTVNQLIQQIILLNFTTIFLTTNIMKAKLTLLFTCGILYTQAQFINQISISPSNPTTNDPIYFIADCYFGSGTCDQKTQLMSINGTEISASAMHCVGMLSYICSATDSFYLGLLPAGTYSLTFSLDAGYGTMPCSPGIIQGPMDSLTFTVQSATGLSEVALRSIQLSPNPTSGKATISIPETSVSGQIEIRNNTGALIKKWNSIKGESTLDFSELSNGIYQLTYTNENGQRKSVNFIKTDK